MRKTTMTVFVVLFSVVAVTSVFGFALIGNKWFATPRNILVDQSGEDSINDGDNGITAVRNAVTSEWNGPAGNLITTSVGDTSGVSINDGISMMVFEDPFKICSGSCIGVTTVGVTTGNTQTFNDVQFEEYLDSDIFFNKRSNFATLAEGDGCSTSPRRQAEFYIEAIAVHEVGHLLGLGHTSVGGATMFASTSYCQIGPATLAADDIAGIECIYLNGASCGGGGPCTVNNVTATTSSTCPGNGANALFIDVLVESNCGALSGADVTIDLTNSCGASLTGTATTGSDGTVRFRLRKSQAETGPYNLDVTVADPNWDGSGDTTSCSVGNANGTCQ
jgi:hypothetical protein